MTTTRSRPPRIPADAQRLRTPLWKRSQARARERWGFDLDARDALERARSLVDEEPDDAERRVLLASVLATRGDADAAEAEARRAVDLSPRLVRAQTTLATILVQRGEREEGLLCARNAAALDMEDPHVLYNLGLAEWVAGERRTAKAAFKRALENLAVEEAPGTVRDGRQAGDAQDGEPARRPWWRRSRRPS